MVSSVSLLPQLLPPLRLWLRPLAACLGTNPPLIPPPPPPAGSLAPPQSPLVEQVSSVAPPRLLLPHLPRPAHLPPLLLLLLRQQRVEGSLEALAPSPPPPRPLQQPRLRPLHRRLQPTVALSRSLLVPPPRQPLRLRLPLRLPLRLRRSLRSVLGLPQHRLRQLPVPRPLLRPNPRFSAPPLLALRRRPRQLPLHQLPPRQLVVSLEPNRRLPLPQPNLLLQPQPQPRGACLHQSRLPPLLQVGLPLRQPTRRLRRSWLHQLRRSCVVGAWKKS